MIIFQKERVNSAPAKPAAPLRKRADLLEKKAEPDAGSAPASPFPAPAAPTPAVPQEAAHETDRETADRETTGRKASPDAATTQEVTADEAAPVAAVRETGGAWRVLPLEGRYEIAYADAFGRPSRRRIDAAELKVGPGKLLLGGVDTALDAYRGFRVDRIHALRAVETGEVVSRNIVDWLLAEAAKLAKVQRRAAVAAARPDKASGPATAVAA